MGTFLSVLLPRSRKLPTRLAPGFNAGWVVEWSSFLLLWLEKTKKENKEIIETMLVGGFNPSEKYESNGIISPNRDENKKYLKPPPSYKWSSSGVRTGVFQTDGGCWFQPTQQAYQPYQPIKPTNKTTPKRCQTLHVPCRTSWDKAGAEDSSKATTSKIGVLDIKSRVLDGFSHRILWRAGVVIRLIFPNVP